MTPRYRIIRKRARQRMGYRRLMRFIDQMEPTPESEYIHVATIPISKEEVERAKELSPEARLQCFTEAFDAYIERQKQIIREN